MADEKWSAFTDVGNLATGDQIVGLRSGVNVRFTAPIFDQQIVVVTSASATMLTETIYIANFGSLVTLSLPATSEVGDLISVVGYGAGGWSIAQGAGQQIFISPNQTTLGATGSLSSSNRYDSLNLICVAANTLWTTFGSPQSDGLAIV
jgi:hypothetical protein